MLLSHYISLQKKRHPFLWTPFLKLMTLQEYGVLQAVILLLKSWIYITQRVLGMFTEIDDSDYQSGEPAYNSKACKEVQEHNDTAKASAF